MVRYHQSRTNVPVPPPPLTMRCRTFCKQSFTSVLIVIKLCLALLDYGSFLSLWVAIQNGENCAS